MQTIWFIADPCGSCGMRFGDELPLGFQIWKKQFHSGTAVCSLDAPLCPGKFDNCLTYINIPRNCPYNWSSGHWPKHWPAHVFRVFLGRTLQLTRLDIGGTWHIGRFSSAVCPVCPVDPTPRHGASEKPDGFASLGSTGAVDLGVYVVFPQKKWITC